MKEFLRFAEELVNEAGRLMIFYRDRELSVKYKTPKSIVTEADLVIQKTYNSAIAAKFPDHQIIGEEESYQPQNKNSKFVWAIDPIDGTTNFVSGLDYFCTSIALIHNGEPIAAVIYAPAFNDYLFKAEIGRGAFLNGRQLRVKTTENLAEMVGAVDVKSDQGFCGFENKLILACRSLRSPGAMALELAEVAAGRYDFHVHQEPKLWDLSAGQLLIKEAGGQSVLLENRIQLSASEKAFDAVKNLLL